MPELNIAVNLLIIYYFSVFGELLYQRLVGCFKAPRVCYTLTLKVLCYVSIMIRDINSQPAGPQRLCVLEIVDSPHTELLAWTIVMSRCRNKIELN